MSKTGLKSFGKAFHEDAANRLHDGYYNVGLPKVGRIGFRSKMRHINSTKTGLIDSTMMGRNSIDFRRTGRIDFRKMEYIDYTKLRHIDCTGNCTAFI